MSTETDIRLRSWLDTNQRDREQMCRSVLALDPRYSDVQPRHPLGGPDGGRDIEAIFDGAQTAYGAVGFQNSANDADRQKKQIRKKFSQDIKTAVSSKNGLKVFTFFTNIHFTIGEQSEMKKEGLRAGIDHCDIFDRERIRIELDSPAGFFIRFQYLSISLSEAEQASFLARYGDRIQEVVSTGFQKIERTLNRLLFLQESSDVLRSVFFSFKLKQEYPAVEIGHFRAFVDIYLREVKHDILEIMFGVTDRSDRFRDNTRDSLTREPPGIINGISSSQWEKHVVEKKEYLCKKSSSEVSESDKRNQDIDSKLEMVSVGRGSSIGMKSVYAIVAQYTHDDFLIRTRPRLSLKDLNECMFLPIINLSLAEKLESIEIFANGYKLAHIAREDFNIEMSGGEVRMPDAFTETELEDPWVRIRPSNLSSTFNLYFDSVTPRRMFGHDEMPDIKPAKRNSISKN